MKLILIATTLGTSCAYSASDYMAYFDAKYSKKEPAAIEPVVAEEQPTVAAEPTVAVPQPVSQARTGGSQVPRPFVAEPIKTFQPGVPGSVAAAPVANGPAAFNGSAVNKPAFNAPAVNGPAVNAPYFNAPAVNAPAANSPAINQPAFNEPVVNAPTFNSPAFNAPAVNGPAVNGPAINAPAINTPAFNAPAFNAPAVSGLAINAPAVNAPAVNAPVANAPVFDGPHDDTTVVEETVVEPLNGWVPNESLPCYGLPGAIPPVGFFDPLHLSKDLNLRGVKRYREAEIMHGRVSMLATIGYLIAENTPTIAYGVNTVHVNANTQITEIAGSYLVPFFVLINTFETYRAKIGWVEPGKGSFTIRDDYYPGDIGFDLLGLKPKDPKAFEIMQCRELSHGRLATLAIAGMICQEQVNGKGILENLGY